MSDLDSIPALIDQLCEMFDESVAALRSALARYLLRGERPDPEARARGLFAYPELRIDYSFDRPPNFPPRAFGRLEPARPLRDQHRPAAPLPQISRRAARISGPRLSGRHLGRPVGERDPLSLRARRHRRPQARRRPRRRLSAAGSRPPSSPISATRSPTAPGIMPPSRAGRWPCSTARGPISPSPGSAIIPARRPSTPSTISCSPTISATSTSSSAGRSTSCAATDSPYEALVGARRQFSSPATPTDPVARDRGGQLAQAPDAGLPPDRGRWRRHHPRQHRRRPVQRQDDLRPSRGAPPGGLADDRPLRGPAPSQTIGDYVLAHAYLRDDHVLDDVLPVEIPIPPIAEVQLALYDAAAEVTGEEPQDS